MSDTRYPKNQEAGMGEHGNQDGQAVFGPFNTRQTLVSVSVGKKTRNRDITRSIQSVGKEHKKKKGSMSFS